MKILIAGMAKTGTTALFYKVKHAFPTSPRCLFEQRTYVPHAIDDRLGVLAKIIVSPHGYWDYKSFEGFDKIILLVRDPRDRMISELLFVPATDPELWKSKKLASYLQILRRKEKDPSLVGVVEIFKALWRFQGYAFSHSKLTSYLKRGQSFFLQYHEDHPNAFVLRYEDLIDDNLQALESYLGLSLPHGNQVEKLHSYIGRTKGAGFWKQCFLPADVRYFASTLQPYMQQYGYDGTAPLAKLQVIPSRLFSGYVVEAVRQVRLHWNGHSRVPEQQEERWYHMLANKDLRIVLLETALRRYQHRHSFLLSLSSLRLVPDYFWMLFARFWQRLTARRFQARLAKPRNTEIGIFLHIEKSAGSSLVALLERHFAPSERLALYGDRPFIDHQDGKLRSLANRAEVLAYVRGLSATVKQRIKVIYGHFAHYGVHEVFQQRPTYLTFLRHPVARVRSEYNYRRTLREDGRASAFMVANPVCKQGGKPLSFDLWLETYQVMHNHAARMLGTTFQERIPRGALTKSHADRAKAVLSKFAFVGLTESFRDDARIFCKMLGIPFTHHRLNRSKKYVRELALGTKEKVESLNKVDGEIYVHAQILRKKGRRPRTWLLGLHRG
jgi:hypothetical protein